MSEEIDGPIKISEVLPYGESSPEVREDILNQAIGEKGKTYSGYRCYFVNRYSSEINDAQLYLRDHLDELNQDEVDKKFDIIKEEYKIHLQVSDDAIPYFMGKVAGLIDSNPEFKNLILAYKARISERRGGDDTEALPDIVIYPKDGRENFERALEIIKDSFKDDEYRGTGITPRYNYQINKLIYVAQSGGDIKKFLRKKGVLNKFFREDLNYSFAIGEEPPSDLNRSARGVQESKKIEESLSEVGPEISLQGDAIYIEYDKKPIDVSLGGYNLSIIRTSDFHHKFGFTFTTEYVLIDRELFFGSGGKKGFKAIRDGELIDIGRASSKGSSIDPKITERFQLYPRNEDPRRNYVSRKHLRILRSGDKFLIEDLGSSNGTKVKYEKKI